MLCCPSLKAQGPCLASAQPPPAHFIEKQISFCNPPHQIKYSVELCTTKNLEFFLDYYSLVFFKLWVSFCSTGKKNINLYRHVSIQDTQPDLEVELDDL